MDGKYHYTYADKKFTKMESKKIRFVPQANSSKDIKIQKEQLTTISPKSKSQKYFNKLFQISSTRQMPTISKNNGYSSTRSDKIDYFNNSLDKKKKFYLKKQETEMETPK